MAKNSILYNIEEIFSIKGFLKEGECFNIPEYQRGYKWSAQSITKLLDDINSFETHGDSKKFYCLQNITIVYNEKEKEYNVVDGQQRLTTLTILLSYFDCYDLIKNKLKYSIRKDTQNFIENYIYRNRKEEWKSWNADWNVFLQSNSQYDFQDIFYIFTAFNTIENWFQNHDTTSFLNKLLQNVDIIVNQPKTKAETKLFANLNGEKVSLDGADIVRAMIVTYVAKEECDMIMDEGKMLVMINERRVRTGMTLDDITRWWTKQDHVDYFKPFIKGVGAVEDEMLKFIENNNAINRLYKLYIASQDNAQKGMSISLEKFEHPNPENSFSLLYEDLVWLQRLIESWYDDKVLYHLIPFCIIYCKKSFFQIVDEWKKSTRKKFEKWLKTVIRDWIINEDISLYSKELMMSDIQNENEAKIEETRSLAEDSEKLAYTENWYRNPYLEPILVLLDIIAICNSDSNEKLPPLYFTSFKEDEEHIFPQTPIEKISRSEYANQTKKLRKYLAIVNDYIQADMESPIAFDENDTHWDDEKWCEEQKTRYNNIILKHIPINSLGNMALLNESVNRSYGNDFFTEKRIDVMKAYRWGRYIRPHVMDAFNKQFLERADLDDDFSRMKNWDKKDILARREYIVRTICDFLNIQFKGKNNGTDK
ncbi:MAG: DUF262 domain-containing protein [Bacteroidales bacterium]|nr:DUF262 domain-containing protein [Bacteroidales bacterium]